jgi:hypothetical protein
MTTPGGGPQEQHHEVAQRRDRMEATIQALDRVITLDAPDDVSWCAAAREAVDAAATTWARHVTGTEAPAGILPDVVDREPRLVHLVDTLRTVHVEIQALLHKTRAGIRDDDVAVARPAVAELSQRLSRHHDRGAEMLHLVYDVDLGGGG